MDERITALIDTDTPDRALEMKLVRPLGRLAGDGTPQRSPLALDEMEKGLSQPRDQVCD
jgi:hypothetical protein